MAMSGLCQLKAKVNQGCLALRIENRHLHVILRGKIMKVIQLEGLSELIYNHYMEGVEHIQTLTHLSESDRAALAFHLVIRFMTLPSFAEYRDLIAEEVVIFADAQDDFKLSQN
jgi:hypothetical protein